VCLCVCVSEGCVEQRCLLSPLSTADMDAIHFEFVQLSYIRVRAVIVHMYIYVYMYYLCMCVCACACVYVNQGRGGQRSEGHGIERRHLISIYMCVLLTHVVLFAADNAVKDMESKDPWDSLPL